MKDHANHENRSIFGQLWERFIRSDDTIQKPDQRRQAQFLALLIVVLAPLGIMAGLLPQLLNSPNNMMDSADIAVLIIATLLAAGAYRLSRGRHYLIAARIIVLTCSAAIFASALTDHETREIEPLVYLIIPVLLSSVLLPPHFTLMLMTAHLVTILTLPAFMPIDNPVDSLVKPISFNLLASITILLVTRHRAVLESDHRRELERDERLLQDAYDALESRVSERTVELLKTNTRLREQMAERERAEAQLAAERNLLRTLIDALPDPIFIVDRQSRYVLDNQAHLDYLGLRSQAEIIGKTPFDFYPRDVAERFTTEERRIVESGVGLYNLVEVGSRDDRPINCYLVTKVPLRNSSGTVTGLVGIARDITEQKQAEQALATAYADLEARVAERTAALSSANTRLLHQIGEREVAEARLRYQANLLESVSEAIISTDLNFRVLSWNHAAEVIYGWTREEVVGHDLVKLLPTEYLGAADEEAANRLFETGEWQGEVIHRRKDNSTIYIYSSVTVIRDSEGRPVGAVGVNRDITERKQAEAAEREQRLLAEALRDSAAVINSTLEPEEVLDRIFTYIVRIIPCETANLSLIENDTARVVRSWHKDDEYVRRLTDWIRLHVHYTPTLREMIDTHQPLVIPNTDEFPGWIKGRNGPPGHSFLAAPIIVGGVVIGFLNLQHTTLGMFDLSHAQKLQAFANQAGIAIHNARMYEASRRHAVDLEHGINARTAELVRQQAQLHAILDSMSEGVVGQLGEGENYTQFVNAALVRMTGYPADEWAFRRLRPSDRSEEEWQEILESLHNVIMETGSWEGEGRIQRADGNLIDVYFTSNRIDDIDGTPLGTVTIARDISQEKTLREQKSRFVANASHELRTPLTNLMTRLYLLRKKPDRLDEHLEILEAVAQRMRSLIEDLLDYSRFERGVIQIDPQPVDALQLINNVIALQEQEAAKKGIALAAKLPTDPVIIMADTERFTQVLTNLVTNAINYTSEGGRVQVEVLRDQNDTSEQAIIRVCDNGSGIPGDILENIFLPFYRGSDNKTGTGLGLSISKEIVEMHGGTITVESEVGKGSCFIVKLATANSLVTGQLRPEQLQ